MRPFKVFQNTSEAHEIKQKMLNVKLHTCFQGSHQGIIWNKSLRNLVIFRHYPEKMRESIICKKKVIYPPFWYFITTCSQTYIKNVLQYLGYTLYYLLREQVV